ncbi:PH domain-containing protein [Bacillus sp. AGMB 02131]|uniref:PH domain-containing protein n=1 Tax=Peribacillus faecalis TaxID=2772559 RepID=A0A927CZ53_9BACI|nr:PH domain-containing protein [Peribacillus faecalis]MBD3109691.1 PH domain-containing protein [Peribacillus faecalis]
MSEARRLHPAAIVLNVSKTLKEAFIPLILFIVLQSSNDSPWSYFELIVLGGALVLGLISGIVTWYKFTYEIDENEIRIRSGVFIKKERFIRLERIQSIDITEGIIQRLFSLVKVSIETAGSSSNGKAEAELTAITKAEAALFQTLLQASKKKQDPLMVSSSESEEEKRESAEERKLFELSFSKLCLMAATSGGVGVVLSGAFVLYTQFSEVISQYGLYNDVEELVASSIMITAGLIFFGVVIAYIIATLRIILKYAYFTVTKSGNELIISRGLLEKRRLTIPIHRIQALRIVENIVREPFGYATLYVETASGSIQNEGNANVMLLPIIKKKRIKALLASFDIDYELEVAIKHVPKRAMRRYLIRALLWNIPLVAVWFLFKPFGYVYVIWLPICIALAYAAFRTAGWNIANKQLTLVFRKFVSKQTYVVLNNKIQSLTYKQSDFQKRSRLGTINVFSKTGVGPSMGRVIDVEQGDMLAIKDWFRENHSVKKASGEQV